MDIQDYQYLSGDLLKEKIRSLSRSVRDEQIRQFGVQYALLCQRLEALYTPDRLDLFLRLRPGGLTEIDKAIELIGQSNPKELAMLNSFRELNRVLHPFMDVYEEQVFGDLKYMDQEELKGLYGQMSEQMAAAHDIQKKHPLDERQAQNVSGTLRLTALMKEGIQRELKERFGVILSE